MSKKIKLLIVLITIIVVIGLVCGIRAIRNFIVLNTTISKLEDNIEKDNYYLKTTLKMKDKTTVTEAYYRNGIGKLVSSEGIYSWVNGEKAYMVDETDKKIYNMEISSENSSALVSKEMFVSLIPGTSKNIFQRFLMSGNLKNSITSEEVNGEKCYKIKIKEETITKTVWVTKSRRLPVKSTIEFSNGDFFEYEYSLKFYITKLKDMEFPDITEYTFYDYKTKEKISESEKIQENNISN